MPECFNCPKCETEIALPEVERMMGLCFCPECEELIDSNTAQAKVPEKPETDDEEELTVNNLSLWLGKANTQMLRSPRREQMDRMWGLRLMMPHPKWNFGSMVLPEVVDCVKCGNGLKLDDEEKMFGICGCPYCKANINHSKGEEVLSILGA